MNMKENGLKSKESNTNKTIEIASKKSTNSVIPINSFSESQKTTKSPEFPKFLMKNDQQPNSSHKNQKKPIFDLKNEDLMNRLTEINCGHEDRFVSKVVDVFPENLNVGNKLKFPLGIAVIPVGDRGFSQESNIPVVEENRIIRGTSGFSYINPFYRFTNNGRSLIGNLGYHTFDIDSSSSLYSPLDENNIYPIDYGTRPELQNSVCDFSVNEAYNDVYKEIVYPHHLIVLDVGYSALRSEVPNLTIQLFQTAGEQNSFGGGKNAKIGIILVSDKVSFLTLNDEKTRIKIMSLNKYQNFESEGPLMPNDIFYSGDDFGRDEIQKALGSLVQDMIDTNYSTEGHNLDKIALRNAINFGG